MSLLSRAEDFLIQRSFRKMARRLELADADNLLSGSGARALRVFHKAAQTVPAYRRILKEQNVSPARIETLDAFRESVPILDKQQWFGSALAEICVGGKLESIVSFYSSSGQTGFFSYGVETRKDQKQGALFLEFALQQAFAALDRKTLLINCLPMGVRVHTRSLALAETSVREDVIWSILRKLEGEFDQFILLGEHPFLKHLIEAGSEQPTPIKWPKLRIHVITGAEYVAESFRSYLASLLGTDLSDPKSGMIVVNYGLSELSVSIAHENWHTIQIRRAAQEDSRLREGLFGRHCPFLPNVMQYYPSQVYLETLPISLIREELVVTLLDPDRPIPMVRYNTGDAARLVSHAELTKRLRDLGRADLIPPLRLPILLLWGKGKGLPMRSGIVYPEQIKQELYVDSVAAAAVTGNFRLERTQPGLELIVQLKDGACLREEIRGKLHARLAGVAAEKMSVKFKDYKDYPFGVRHDFERKNQYV